MTTPNPLAKTKGAGTTFWMYTGNGDAFANPLSDTGWLSSLGKTIASKDVMTRTVKISGVGRPYLAEEGTETVSVTGLTVAPASASVKVGATTTLTFTVKPDGASDKAISVHSSDPQTATVTLNGLVATVKGVKQGSVSIVGMTADGNFVAVAAVTVSAAG